MRGWVYLIINEAMPSLVKIGFSTRDPVNRANELNNTGAPHPYYVAYDALVYNPEIVEKEIHRELSEYIEGKEWFRISISDAANTIRKVASPLYEHINTDLLNSTNQEISNPYEINSPTYSSCVVCGERAQYGSARGPLCDIHYKLKKKKHDSA